MFPSADLRDRLARARVRARRSSAGRGALEARAFSLLELVLVLSLLAILAGSLIANVATQSDDATDQLALRQLQDVRQALLRFRRDMGYFPREGPLRLAVDGGSVGEPATVPELPAGFLMVEGYRRWFRSPANLLCLVQRPVDPNNPQADDPPVGSILRWTLQGSAARLRTYDPETKRGWNGPYLKLDSVAWVTLTDGLLPNDGSGVATGAGHPATGSQVLPPMPALSDLYLHASGSSSVEASWPAAAFEWRLSYNQSADVIDTPRGRPLMIFNVDSHCARLVSSGPDGDYYSHEPTDPLAHGAVYDNSDPNKPWSDDVGLFLVR